ncbi:MAG: protoporphyrinogen oxidase [Betaproteobacteria bacterium]|nr:protoporphyrinogen oxidase [Betaproteobacteria bacterium]
MAEVVVIGAGISGLTAAYALSRAGHDVAVFEQCAAPGGRMRSEQIGGFLMEYGANSIVTPAPGAETLVAQLGLDPERVTCSAAARWRYLVRDGRMRGLPLQPCRFLLSDFLSLGARLRLMAEPFVAARHDDETVAHFVRRRFGTELLDYVVDPLVGGLFAGDPEQLSIAAVFPQLKGLERRAGSVIGGIMRSRLQHGAGRARGGPGQRVLSSFRQGLGTLPRAISRQLAGRVFLGHRVEAVQRRADGHRVKVRHGGDARWTTADSVVVALPAYAAAAILYELDPRIARALAEISHPPVAVVFLGYRARSIVHPLDAVGVLTPATERRGVLGMLFSSTMFPGRAPLGHVALTAFIGGARQPQLATLESEELEQLAQSEVRQLLGGRVAPVVLRAHRWRYGLPQPGLDHGPRLGRITALESEHAGLFLTGNYFSGVSTAACIQQALDTARRIREYLALGPVRRRLVA